MGIFDKLLNWQKKQLNNNIFGVLNTSAAPQMKAEDYIKAYTGWAYACTNAISEDVSTINLNLLKKSPNGEWSEVDSHLALDVLKNVNPTMTMSELIYATQGYLELIGEAFWYLPHGKAIRKPAQIWLLTPTRVKIAYKSNGEVAGYNVTNEKSEETTLNPEEVLHFKRFNPQNPKRGMGTIQAAALALDIDTYSATYNRNFFYNSAMPGAVLEYEGTLTEEQLNRIKTQWESKYKGLDNTQKVAILQGGMKLTPLSITQKDMDFLEQRRFSRDEILAIFRVPKHILGIVEDVNRANAEASDYTFAKRVVKPRMEFITDRLNEFFLPLFQNKGDLTEYKFTFDDPVPDNIELNLKKWETGIKSGFQTINEVRTEQGRDEIDGGDVPLISNQLIPLSEAGLVMPDISEKTINKSVEDDSVGKRVSFIKRQIKKHQAKYKSAYQYAESLLMENLDGANKYYSKKLTKEATQELTRLLFRNWDKFIGLVTEVNEDTLKESVSYAGAQAVREVGVENPFDLENPRVQDFLAEHALNSAKSIGGTTRELVATILAEGVDEGLSTSEIAENIKNHFTNNSSWHALRISRTEVIRGYSRGSLEGYRQSGVVQSKRWLTAPDDRTDEECLMNEQDGPIALDSTFSSGQSCPPVHPNCRCTIIPVTENV